MPNQDSIDKCQIKSFCSASQTLQRILFVIQYYFNRFLCSLQFHSAILDAAFASLTAMNLNYPIFSQI